MPARCLAFAVAVSFGAASIGATAGEVEDKATARELAQKGILAEQAGDCATAIDDLQRAETLYHAPIHLQYLARCYAKAGRVVEATELYRRLVKEKLPDDAPQVFVDAVAEANAQLPIVEKRIAHLTIAIDGTYENLAVTLDGKPVPAAALGVSRVIDPGEHVVRAHAGASLTGDATVTLKDGASDTVHLNLRPMEDGSVAPSKSPPWRTIGVIGMIGGGVLIAGGVVTGVIAHSKYSTLQSDCPNKQCPAGYDVSGKESSIRNFSHLTNALLISGVAIGAIGAGLFFFAPHHETPVTVGFGPGSFEVSGSF